MGISVGLNTAARALLAHQEAIDSVSHNIANASTPGYSRQRVRLMSLPPPDLGTVESNQAGLGVEVQTVARVRDVFVDFQKRAAMQSEGRLAARSASLGAVELALGEPGDSGLRASMSKFWNAWRDLSNDPDSTAARAAVVQAGTTFAFTARRVYDSVSAMRADADVRVQQGITEVNTLASRVASLNEQIARMEVAGNTANDLRDQRDLALDALSQYASIQYAEREDGRVEVSLGGHSLVSGATAYAIRGVTNIANSNFVDVQWAVDGTPVTLVDGGLRGLLEQRDVDLPGRMADLNALVSQVITDVNTAHAAGYGLDGGTGRAFFTGADASNAAVSAAVAGNTSFVAASTTAAGVPGNGANASAVSDLQYAKRLLTNTATYDQFYAGFVSSIGSATRELESLHATQSAVVARLEQVRQSASGVNLDEEMVSMMSYQRAYEAAARMVRVMDELLDTLINRTA